MKIKLEDKQQDFLELSVNKKGIISGYSSMFENGRLSLLGIGGLDGEDYLMLSELLEGKRPTSKNIYVYFKNTDSPEPLPWEAKTLKYKVLEIKDLIWIRKEKNL